MTVSQSSLGTCETEEFCTLCASPLLGRHYHRVRGLLCCRCFVGEGTCGAGWHHECMMRVQKNLPPRKYGDGANAVNRG